MSQYGGKGKFVILTVTLTFHYIAENYNSGCDKFHLINKHPTISLFHMFFFDDLKF